MQRATLMHIAREGLPFVGLVFVLGVLVYYYSGPLAALPVALFALYLIAVFHEPDRRVPAEPLAIIAPVDGRIIARSKCRDPFLGRDAIRVRIRIAHLGAYMFRSPSEGEVLEIPADAGAEAKPGSASWIRTDEQDDIVFVVSAGTLFGVRPCLARYGERVGQGRRCGVRRLARRLDVYLPLNTRLEAEVGSRIRAGRDVLATLVRKTNGNGK